MIMMNFNYPLQKVGLPKLPHLLRALIVQLVFIHLLFYSNHSVMSTMTAISNSLYY